MDTIFMNSENSKRSDPHRLLLNLSDKINLGRTNKLLYQTLAFTIHRKIRKSNIKIIKFKISPLIWNKEFELPNGSNSQYCELDNVEYIFIKHEAVTDNPSIRK